MRIILRQETYRIKNGFAARSPELKLTAHGYSPEVAKANLERVAFLFFRSFERASRLQQEIELLGIEAYGDNLGLSVVIKD